MPSKKIDTQSLKQPTPTPFEQFKALLSGHIPTDKELEDAYNMVSSQPLQKGRTITSADIKEDFVNWIDKHREDIKYATKGYVQKVKDAYEKESGNSLTTWQFRRLLDTYRATHNCPIEYVENKYYKPNRSKYCLSHYASTKDSSAVEN